MPRDFIRSWYPHPLGRLGKQLEIAWEICSLQHKGTHWDWESSLSAMENSEHRYKMIEMGPHAAMAGDPGHKRAGAWILILQGSVTVAGVSSQGMTTHDLKTLHLMLNNDENTAARTLRKRNTIFIEKISASTDEGNAAVHLPTGQLTNITAGSEGASVLVFETRLKPATKEELEGSNWPNEWRGSPPPLPSPPKEGPSGGSAKPAKPPNQSKGGKASKPGEGKGAGRSAASGSGSVKKRGSNRWTGWKRE